MGIFKKLFGKKTLVPPEGSCHDCVFGKSGSINGDVLCEKHGLVSASGYCKKYKKNLLAERPRKKHSIAGDFSPEDFSID